MTIEELPPPPTRFGEFDSIWGIIRREASGGRPQSDRNICTEDICEWSACARKAPHSEGGKRAAVPEDYGLGSIPWRTRIFCWWKFLLTFLVMKHLLQCHMMHEGKQLLCGKESLETQRKKLFQLGGHATNKKKKKNESNDKWAAIQSIFQLVTRTSFFFATRIRPKVRVVPESRSSIKINRIPNGACAHFNKHQQIYYQVVSDWKLNSEPSTTKQKKM